MRERRFGAVLSSTLCSLNGKLIVGNVIMGGM